MIAIESFAHGIMVGIGNAEALQIYLLIFTSMIVRVGQCTCPPDPPPTNTVK
jgi:hypothetical protein